jgi:undecaprenyl-diphosphatase
MITIFQSFVLGVVEGLTEFLPVSSTGHLILVDQLLLNGAGAAGAEKEARDAFQIVIQLGALLAVVVFYRRLLWETFRGVFRGDARAWRLTLSLGVGFLPAAAVGLLLHETIKEHLFGVLPVIAALAVGGVVMIFVERHRSRRGVVGLEGIDEVTPMRALMIGIAQCAALWPGMSRSMSTIVGGQLCGLSTATAAEFSFLLSLPTLGAACLFDLYETGPQILKAGDGPLPLIVGLVVSAVVAWGVIGGFLAYLKRRGLIPFGIYRIVLAAALAVVLVSRAG